MGKIGFRRAGKGRTLIRSGAFLVAFALFGTAAAFSADVDTEFHLRIIFSGITEARGKLLVEVRDEQGRTLSGHQLAAAPDSEGTQDFELLLPQGKYAIAVFHDVNDNGDIDLNWLGAPTEIYGFSNNARGVFSEPELADQLFEHSKNGGVQRIHLR